jgi:hypothetical protein
MVTLNKLYKSTLSTKKLDVYVYNKKSKKIKKISFGAKGMSDYTIHKDKERRERYRKRHRKDKITDPLKPGFWSWWVLWGPYTSKKKNLTYTINRFKLVKKIPSLSKSRSRKMKSKSRSRKRKSKSRSRKRKSKSRSRKRK